MPFATTPDEVRAVTDAALVEADARIAASWPPPPALPTARSAGRRCLQHVDDALDALAVGYGRGAFLGRRRGGSGRAGRRPGGGGAPVDLARRAAVPRRSSRPRSRRARLRPRPATSRPRSAASSTTSCATSAAPATAWRPRCATRCGGCSAGSSPSRRRSPATSPSSRAVSTWTPRTWPGCPRTYVDRLRPGSAPGTLRVTLATPDLMPFLEQADRRDLRERMEAAWFDKAHAENAPLLAEALEIRRRAARAPRLPDLGSLPARGEDGRRPGRSGGPLRVADQPAPGEGDRRARRDGRRAAPGRRGAAGAQLGLALVRHAPAVDGSSPSTPTSSARISRSTRCWTGCSTSRPTSSACATRPSRPTMPGTRRSVAFG